MAKFDFFVVSVPDFPAEGTTSALTQDEAEQAKDFLERYGPEGEHEVVVFAPGEDVPAEIAEHVLDPEES